MPPSPLPAVRVFAPEQWGQAEQFAHLYAETYKLSPADARAVSGVGNHFGKAVTLSNLAHKLRPNLDLDNDEMEQRGFTGAPNGKEFTAVIEAAILELYASVDSAAKVLHAIYGKRSRGLKNSTSGLFKNFDKITGEFPERLKQILRTADWFPELLFLRSEIAHLATGSGRASEREGPVSYMHSGIRRDGRAFIVQDIFGWLQLKAEVINAFHGAVFHYLNSTLLPTPVPVVCGFNQGRILMRQVDPTAPMNFDNGVCLSHTWFLQPGNPGCPFAQHCGAYQRVTAVNSVDG